MLVATCPITPNVASAMSLRMLSILVTNTGTNSNSKVTLLHEKASLDGSVGCVVRLETRTRVQPRRGQQHSFVKIDHEIFSDYEIFSTVILSLPLSQEGQLSVSGERMCTILVNRLACPVNMWLSKLTVLDMTPLG